MWIYFIPAAFMLIEVALLVSGTLESVDIPFFGVTDIGMFIVFGYGYHRDGLWGGIKVAFVSLIVAGVTAVILFFLGYSAVSQGVISPELVEQMIESADIAPGSE